MNYFAPKLNSILSSFSISNSAIAKKSGIDPSLLRRYRKGLRFPRNAKIIEQLCSGLSLSDYDKYQLEKAYYLTKNIKNPKDTSTIDSVSKITADIIPCNKICDASKNNLPKISSITTKDDLICGLSCINAIAKDSGNRVYTMLTHREESLDSKHYVQYSLPDVCQGEYLIFSNLTNGHKNRKEDNFSRFPVHYKELAEFYPRYLYKEECELFYGNTLIVFTENMLVKCTKYEDEISGLCTQDINMINYYHQMYETFKNRSTKI